MFQTSLGFNLFVYVVDCLWAFEGEDAEDCKVKFGFSAFENLEFSTLPLSLLHTLLFTMVR